MPFDSTHAVFDKVRSCFFWEGVGDKHRYHMVDWATLCRPKAFGGLGILNTRHMNIALMLKWIWKLYQNTVGLWADPIRAKYMGDNDLFSPLLPTKGSQFWNSIQKIKWYIKLGVKHSICKGKQLSSSTTGGWVPLLSGSGILSSLVVVSLRSLRCWGPGTAWAGNFGLVGPLP
jgi:hypothetical protein